jgi:ribosome-associated protein
MKDSALEAAKRVVVFAGEKKALKPVILDVRKEVNYCDYFVIVSGDSTVQVRALYNHIIGRAKEEQIPIAHREDDVEDRWLLIDLSDVIVHVFLEEERAYYDLEYLWKKARKIPCGTARAGVSRSRPVVRKKPTVRAKVSKRRKM